MFQARGTIDCSSGSRIAPYGSPYWRPATRSPSATARTAASAAFGPPQLPLRSGAPRSDFGGAATDEGSDVAGGDEDRVDARPLERDDLVPGRRAHLGDRELPGRHVGKQLEHAVERVLVVLGLTRREEEDLRVDALEDDFELLLVADVDHALEAETERPRVVLLELPA